MKLPKSLLLSLALDFMLLRRSDTEIGRLVGDVMQEVAEFAARLGPR